MKKVLIMLMLVSFVFSFALVGTSCKAEEAAQVEEVEETAEEEVEEVAEEEVEEKITLGIAMSTLANPFFVIMKDAGEETAKEFGWDVISLDAQDSSEKQASQMQDLIARDVDIIIVNPTDSDAIVPSVKEANDAGIPVICATRPSNGGKVEQVVNVDNIEAGNLVAEEMIKVLGTELKVAILEGVPGAPSANNRQQGFLDIVGDYPDIEIITSVTANYNVEDGFTVMEDVLQSNPEIDALYCHNDPMALGAIRAATAAGRLEEIAIFGVDGADDALVAIKEGEMVATVMQQPALMMVTAVESAAKVINGEEVEELVIVPLVLVNKDNVDEFLK